MDIIEEHRPGFQFDNFARNEKLIARGIKMPRSTSTGTTIAGIIFKDGVVLGADKRATAGNIVGDKDCLKIHYLQPNMYCCGAGTAADLDLTTEMMASFLELHRLHTGRQVPVVAANQMLKQYLFRYQGYVGAALVLGGVDKHGSHIYTIHPHGSTDRTPYTTMGSGSLAAMTVFESRWKPDMELEEAKQLVKDAIVAGIKNDMGSGTSVDLCVITKDGAEILKYFDITETKGKRQGKYEYAHGTTEILSMKRTPIEIISETISATAPPTEEDMDTA